MARADLLLDLVEAERRGDRERFKVLVESVIAEERANQHHLLADRLSQLITTTGQSVHDDHAVAMRDLIHEVVPSRRLEELVLAPAPRRVVSELIEEQQRADLLRSYGIEPRNRLLLSGPPGNGKTSVAEAIASELMLPFYIIRYEGVMSSFLGETAARLDSAFEFARTRRCVLFFDDWTPSPRNGRTNMRRERSRGWSPPSCCRSTASPHMSSSSGPPTTANC